MPYRRRLAVFILGAGLSLVFTFEIHSEEPSAEPAKHRLAFKFKPNQILRYEIVSEQEITTKAREEEETQKNVTKTKRHHRVTAFDEKTAAADLEISIDWVYMRVDWDKHDGKILAPTEFQSDDPEKQSDKFKQVKATIGKPWATIRFRTTGNPVKVVEAAVKGGDAKNVTTETGADGALDAYLIVLPDHPVAVGETWKEKFEDVLKDENRNRSAVTFQRMYKLTKVEENKATIDLKTIILSPMTNPTIAAQLLLREMSGKVVFDIERGLILSKEWTAQNTVVNPIPGLNSLMEGTGRYSEKLISEEQAPEKTASAAKPTSKD